jgi:hypothetical protein
MGEEKGIMEEWKSGMMECWNIDENKDSYGCGLRKKIRLKKLWGQACDIGILFDKRKAALGSEQAKKLEYWYNGIRKPGIQEFKKNWNANRLKLSHPQMGSNLYP